MTPANQGFGTYHGSGAHVDLGLEIQLEFLPLECLLNVLDGFSMRLGLPVFFRIKQVIAVLACLLGLIHGLVSMAQQGIGVAPILREQGDAQAGRKLQRVLPHLDRCGGRLQQARKDGFAFMATVDGREHGYEFVAAEAGEGVSLPERVAQPLGDAYQQLVAGFVAVRIVDFLESVDIQISDRQSALVPARLGDGLLQAIAEQHPVRDARQGVVMCHMFELLLMFLQLGDVGEQRNVMQRSVVGIAYGGNAQFLGVQIAILVAVPQFSAPVPARREVLPHGAVELRALAPRLQDAGILSEHLFP